MKVYDCFGFFNELELLELRLHTLSDVVDYFVLVEANKTHTNKPKEFILEQNKERYGEFLDRIIYVKVKDLPDGPDTWIRENYQRECITRGLESAEADDLILISDLDEIPNPNKIMLCAELPLPASFEQKRYFYFVNCLHTLCPWNGTIAIRRGQMTSPQAVRRARGKAIRRLKRKRFWQRGNGKYFNIEQGGWHFSYLGGINRIIEKINAFAHTEYNTELTNNPVRIKQIIESGGHLLEKVGGCKPVRSWFGRNKQANKFVEIDDTFPPYTKTLIKKYPYLYFDKDR